MNLPKRGFGLGYLLLGLALSAQCWGGAQPVCPSNIYCQGELLDKVQMFPLFPDSKTFVDMPLKYEPSLVLRKFSLLMNKTQGTPSYTELMDFLDIYFEPAGSELQSVVPDDWSKVPSYLENIKDENYKNWALDLNIRWLTLTKKFKEDVGVNTHLYSSIYVPYPFIVPGGRFREFYYWDSYWILRAILISGMKRTAKGMLYNFLTLVKRFGMVPTGSRVYYSSRSQPPLLIPMFDSYLEATDDLTLLRENIQLLEEEFLFWMKNRMTGVTKNGMTYRVAVYSDKTSGPRPESYKIDKYLAFIRGDDTDIDEVSMEVKSVAESGWDFSSRWLLHPNQSEPRNDIIIKYIAPVDLNSILCWNARLLSKFYLKINDVTKALAYKDIYDEWITMLENVLWDDKTGSWYDYDIVKQKPRKFFYLSNVSPIWTGCFPTANVTYYSEKVTGYLSKKAYLFRGGIPSSMRPSGEQWDFPNAWAPLHQMVIAGLRATGGKEAEQLALYLADKWVRNSYESYVKSKDMFEKYDVNERGKPGIGGEYIIQNGFGWSNAVIIELLNIYGDQLIVTQD